MSVTLYQVGRGGTQINYNYGERTWADGVVAPPMVDVSGVIDSPYRGLRPFEERDAPFFFGREAAAEEVLQRMSRQLGGMGLLVLSGLSGAGKSSLLRAGVLPRLRGAGIASALGSASWPCLLFSPTHAPLDELAVRVARLAGADAAAVRRGLEVNPAGFALTARQAAQAQQSATAENLNGPRTERRLLLIIDQFEQLFTQCPDEGQRRAFITALHAAGCDAHGVGQTPAALVVLGVRADFEARCADYPQLAAGVQERYLVTAMTERQLRMAIIEPAKKAGAGIDPDLVDQLLRELYSHDRAVSGAGALPLLSHALDRAWRGRSGQVITLADYERTGGIEGALADSAERAYDRLTPTQRTAARQIFIRLTAASGDAMDTGQRATRNDLMHGRRLTEVADVDAVLEAFADERLLTLAEDTVELGHEVLLTAWPLLRDTWLAETHADRIVVTRLHNAAAEWAQGSRDPTYLYRGSQLEAAIETASRIEADPGRYPPLGGAEQDFLQSSQRAQRRTVRRRRIYTAALVALVVAFTSAAAIALLARRDAIRQHNAAVSGQLVNLSEALRDSDPAVSKLLSIAAWRFDPTDNTRYAMLGAAARPGMAVLTDHRGYVSSVAFSPDGRTLASGGGDAVQLWDIATRSQAGEPLTGHTSGVLAVAFSSDGGTLASGDFEGTVRLWDLATGRQLGEPLIGHRGAVGSLVFSSDDESLVSVSDNGTVRLWDVATGRQVGGSRTGDNQGALSVALSPDGKTVATGQVNGTVRIWDSASGQRIIIPLMRHPQGEVSLAFSRDGKTLASGGGFDGTVRLWDVATGHPLGEPLTSPSTGVGSVVFSPDGKTIAVGDAEGPLRVWDVASHRQIGEPIPGPASGVSSAAFSPDGQTLASGSRDGTVRLWHVASGRQIGRPDQIPNVAFSSDGETLASIHGDGTVRLWDAATRRKSDKPYIRHAGLWSLEFSPDGETLAGVGLDGTVPLWDLATGRQIGSLLTDRTSAIEGVAFSPDGETLASTGEDGTVRLWDVATRRHSGDPLIDSRGGVSSVAFSPDGKLLASGDYEGPVRLWDVATRRQVGEPLVGHTDLVTVVFNRDGKTLASASDDLTLRLWDVATGRQIGAPLTGHTRGVRAVAFSPDGKTLASGSIDGTVRLWDVATGRQIGTPLTGSTSGIRALAFSSDGKTLMTGDYDGPLRRFDVAYIDDVTAYLCASVGRSLTRAEWDQYVGNDLSYQPVCP